ncbi:hypothetical protein [Craterilacuibacter sp. RT1T]|uniref:hypothetical protein n=1 Tax=Craterilacuibacter sp. RT1T TaxID=2942211 RepID=UPI0020C10E5E|nr:hypothetical protein [Craterilacuibacter sp. RT1T]MCL6264381.1 hypothetical protein [Craterilacuibacter sp. RT1T]
MTTTPCKTMKHARAASATANFPAPTLVTAKDTARPPVRATQATTPAMAATGKRLTHVRSSDDQGHNQTTSL